MIPNIDTVGGEGIPFIQVNGTGIKLIQSIRSTVKPIGVNYISDARVWIVEPPQAIPITVPVTTVVGTPIINMPGCVKVHKENSKRDPSKRRGCNSSMRLFLNSGVNKLLTTLTAIIYDTLPPVQFHSELGSTLSI